MKLNDLIHLNAAYISSSAGPYLQSYMGGSGWVVTPAHQFLSSPPPAVSPVLLSLGPQYPI